MVLRSEEELRAKLKQVQDIKTNCVVTLLMGKTVENTLKYALKEREDVHVKFG